jgi:hypothetical protein
MLTWQEISPYTYHAVTENGRMYMVAGNENDGWTIEIDDVQVWLGGVEQTKWFTPDGAKEWCEKYEALHGPEIL